MFEDTKTVVETVERLGNAQTIELERGTSDKCPALLLPKGLELRSMKPLLDEYLVRPERRKGTARLDDLDSFCFHVGRFKDEDSALFCFTSTNGASQVLLGVLDYHREGADGLPRFGEHRAKYSFPFSQEWKAWVAQNGKEMSQLDFAQFLENRIVDVVEPTDANKSANELVKTLQAEFAAPSRLLTLSRGLSVNVERKVAAQHRLESGEAQISFTEEHSDEAGQPLKIPSAFLIAIPVFYHDALYRIGVRLRYRLRGQTVVWCYELYRTDVVLEDAIAIICKIAADRTQLPLFRGRPESSSNKQSQEEIE